MTLTIYDEAGGSGYQGMSFVADTVINRVHSPRFPNNVTDVIFQKGQFAWPRRYKHKTVEDLHNAKVSMIKRKEGNYKTPVIWFEAMKVADDALKPDYKPKTHELFFSSKTIMAHAKHKR